MLGNTVEPRLVSGGRERFAAAQVMLGSMVEPRLVSGGRERFAAAPSGLSVFYRSLLFFLGGRTVLNVADALIKSISSKAT